MNELPKRRIWLPSADFLVFMGVGAILSALAIPALVSSQRAANERNASTSLKAITSAEADFRANDRDGNHVHDFWTGDLSGLHYMRSPDSKAELRLVEAGMANADAKPLFPVVPRADSGYFFLALDRDDSVTGKAGFYKVDTDKSGHQVHHESRFGFSAYPKDGGSGKYVFFVNENNTIFRVEGTKPRNAFPSDLELMSFTGRSD